MGDIRLMMDIFMLIAVCFIGIVILEYITNKRRNR
jgi:hypothetical protein